MKSQIKKHQKNNPLLVGKTINQMKIVLASLIVLLSTSAFANQPVVPSKGEIHSSGTHFATPPSDSWCNVNSDNAVKAAYADFDGEAFVTLVAYDKQTDITLDFNIAVSKGELQLVVQNSQNEIIYQKTFSSNETVRATLTLEVYEEYKISFKGNESGGAYECKWTQQ